MLTMAERDSLDTNFLVLVVVLFIGIAALAFAIFPRHEAEHTAASPAPAATPQKK
jgi:uncharacterized protein (UPF0333 family)